MNPTKISTGIKGLDTILDGGLISGKSYLLSGGPGSGKTTLGFHFLTAEPEERSVFISLSESCDQLKQNASNLGFDISKIDFLDLSPTEDVFVENQSYDIFLPSEVDREPMTQQILLKIDDTRPKRIFIDSMTQLKYLSPDMYQYRKQVLSFIKYLIDRDITIMFSSEATNQNPDDDLQFMSDGMIFLGNSDNMRTVEVKKFRGSDYRSGKHVMKLTDKGAYIFPKILPKKSLVDFHFEQINSGIPELDELLGGGIERGTTTIISGPSGVGKTTLGIQFMKEGAGRGENSIVYSFEEHPEKLINRCSAIKIPVKSMVERGTLKVKHIEPLFYSPDEFAYMVKEDIEENNTKIVMIDSISGYSLSMKGTDLVAHLHSLSRYLSNLGITVILINESENITGEFKATDMGISYLADNVVFLRYLEILGEMRKSIGVLKKRLGDFEKTVREFAITKFGIKIGKPLVNLRNILSGVPEFINSSQIKDLV